MFCGIIIVIIVGGVCVNLEQILAAKRGDQAAFAALTDIYAPLMDSLVAKYAFAAEGFGMDTEDLRQEASVAFYRALMTYDTEQSKVSFGLYAKICIRNRMISLLRHFRAEKNRGSASAVPSPPAVTEGIGFPFDGERLRELADEVLTPKEKTVFLLYIGGSSYQEIADHLGVTTKSVDNALYRAKAKLRSGFQG